MDQRDSKKNVSTRREMRGNVVRVETAEADPKGKKRKKNARVYNQEGPESNGGRWAEKPVQRRGTRVYIPARTGKNIVRVG